MVSRFGNLFSSHEFSGVIVDAIALQLRGVGHIMFLTAWLIVYSFL
jgi:hypothetical protein